MGSIETRLPLKTGTLGRLRDFPGSKVPTKTLAETIWAITCFVYTGNNDVSFVSYSPKDQDRTTEPRLSPATRQYRVEEDAKPAEIAKSGCDIAYEDFHGPALELETSGTSFAHLIKTTALLVIEDDASSELQYNDQSKQIPHSMLFCISTQDGCIQGTILPRNSRHYDYVLNIIDTIEKVGELVLENWTSPLTQMNFLSPENLYRIISTAPEPVQIGSFALCEILAQQRKLRPHRVAVEAWDGDFTYGELYDLSRRMAARLLQLGVHEEERIGICMRKSKWAIVAFWGILMAGCAGVPLNIRNPPKRTEALLRRVNARYLVTDQHTEAELDGLDIGILHCSSEVLEKVDCSCPELQWPRISPWTEAFIMFTSGSTGLPKGAVVEHGPLYTKMMEIPAAISLDETSKVFQFSDFIFDGAFADIFATMAAGGCVCIPSEEERLNNISAVLQRSRATHIFIPNSVLAQIQPKDVPHLRHLTVGGEILTKESIQRWSPHVQMISVYGITETIVFDSYASSERLATDYCNIGLAKGNCLWVTDPNDLEKLKPIGAVGEILVEGPLLARGYMDDLKRTTERFVPAPLWLQELRGKQPNHRCFRSGDYGIRNADGTVSYVCRADAQVKLGGQRVELGEIEHSLCVAEPMLDQIAVEVVKLQSRENRQMLVAFVKRPPVEVDGSSPLMPMDQESKRIMRSAQSKLLESLPRYMVPSVYIPIQDLPKSATGKRDRKTLQSWGSLLTEDQLSQYQLRDSAVYRSPVTWEEKLLQRLWAQILRAPVASLGTNDNFFQVGGDSIKAIELVQALRKSGRVLTVSQIFKYPEMREAAQLLGNADRKAPEEVLPQLFELIPNSVARVDCVQEAARVCNVNVDMVEDIYPTTPMQEALIAISAHRPNVYTHRVVFRLPKSLDVERFKKAWAAMVSQQSIFRTRIVTLHGVGTVQVVLRSDMNWQTGMTLEEFVQHDEKKSVTYGSALSRYAIVHDEQGTLYFVWSGHHAISDGWSRTLMYKEINQIYNHGVASQQTSYTPFIQYINALDLEEADQFWSEQFPDTVESFPCLPSPEYTPDARQMQSLSLQLNRKATSSITTATLVQAAWALVTAAYAGTDDAIFGLTLSGRDTSVPGITSMMGITITTVPVRVILDNTSTISEYLENVLEYVSQVRQHQHVGLQRICRLSPEARSAGGFQNLLVIQPVDEDEGHQGMTDLGLELVQREENDTLDYALTVQCTIDGNSDSLHIKAHYDENIIPKKQMECLLHLFDHIIKQLATESTSRSLYDLDKVSPHDLGLFSAWNAQMPAPVEKTIHGLFEEQTRLAPNAMALDGVYGPLTYAELDILSNRLASHIQQQAGALLEQRVMLCFRKSNIPIIAMLATLKIGGVCVSINPEHPASRLLELSSDVESRVVLCGGDDVEQFTGHIPHVICVTDTLLAQLRSEPVTKTPLTILPSNAAFIVYTSGSTGKPKGSVIEHRSLATHLAATGQQVGLDAQSRTLQFSSYTFDCHLLEIFGTFIHGGCVQVISDHERMNFLSEVINERQINFAVLTKTVSRLLEPENVPTLKTLILTGEPNGRQDYWRWAKQLRLFNGLGPSECTPLACLTRGPVSIEDDPANIGHAVGCQIWIADHRRLDRLVPVGCVGELIVEGPIVGRGYANRPKESAASFIQNLAWSRDGSGSCRRFYRSGDLAKMNVDGSITFVGRADSQIKLHGQRVELGEIEDHLRRCSSVFTTSAVDTFQTTNRGDATVLVVFCSFGGNRQQKLGEDDGKDILPIDEKSRSAFKEAQTQLSNFLPRYMVPSIFIPVRHLPFNTSGKLERKVLRKWAAALNADDLGQYYLANPTSSRALKTEEEKSLQALWARVLNVAAKTIHADDNFFRLGGDSVLAMKLIAEARADGISLTVADVFRVPLLHEMALVMVTSGELKDQKKAAIEPMSLIKNKVDPETCIKEAALSCGVAVEMIEDIYPCNPTQEVLMAVSSHRPKAYTHQIVLILPQSMDLDRFKSAWENVVAAQAIYRTRIIFQRSVGSLQVVLRSNITWHTTTGVSLEQYLQSDGALLVEYGSELCKFTIIQTGGQSIFVATLHHSLYDGWSIMRTYQNFSEIYRTGTLEKPVVPYSSFFQFLSTVDETEVDNFWRGQFPSIIQSWPQLPSAQYVARPQHHKSSTIPFHREPGSEATIATVIQTAWAILMSKFSESQDVIFGLMLSGRDAPVEGISDIIGPTIANVPMSVQLDPEMTITNLLRGIQQKTAELRKHQHAGLQRIRRLGPAASAAVDFRNLLVVHTMGDNEVDSPLSAIGLQSQKLSAEEFLDIALTVDCTIRPDTLHVLINYDQGIVTDRQVDFMLHELQHIISTLLGKPGIKKLQDFDFASPYDSNNLNTVNGRLGEPLVGPPESSSNSIVVKQNPTNATEISLQLVWSQILNRPLCDIGMHDTFTSLGGDSITAMQIVSECRRLGIMVRVVTILMKKTIADISPHCTFNHSFAPGSTPTVADGPSFNLAPIQKLYFKQESQNWTCYNQAFLCRVKKGVSVGEARHAFDIIVARHAMLRVRFRKDEDGSKWAQYTVPPTPGTYRFQSHSLGPIQNDTRDAIAASVATCSQESISSIDITHGPIFSVDFFDVTENDSMMYLVAHHLVIDLVSWRIIWRDFEEIIRNGSVPGDLSPSLPFQNWVSLQEQCYDSTKMSPATVYPPLLPLAPQFDFWGVSEQDNILEYCVEQSFSLSPHITSLILGKGNQALRTTPLDIIVGHLVHSFQHVFQDRAAPPIFIEHHGREQFDGADDIDLSQTVGWFTAMYPVNIPLTQSATCNEAIRLAKDTRNSIPGNGQPYFAFRHLSPDGDLFADHAPVEILVNFLGIFQQLETSDGLIQLETRVSAPEQESASTAHRFAMIDLSVGVSHGVMDFTFTTHKQIAHGDRVREWISHFQDSLTRSLPKLAIEAPTYTLSDFPRLKLTYEDLQDLLSNKLPVFEIGIEQHGGIMNIIEDIYPCTAMQEGILLSQQTDNQVYLGRRIWEFTSDPLISENLASRLEEAWKTVVKRHVSLRTGIIEHATDHSHFLQVVLKSLPSSRFVKAKAVIGDVSEISNILEPDEDSFWMHVPRLTMYQTKNNRVACSLKLSHVLMDGMSLDVFMKELIGILSGRTLMPSTAMDFGRYIDYEQSANPDQTLEYWTGYLSNVQPCHIPIQEPQNVSTASQEYGYIQVPEDATAGLVAFCQRLDITPAVLIQTAWAIVLGAFTGQEDVCFGYLASGRDAPIDGIEESTGLFISMQVCRVRLEGMVNELLQGVHRSIIAGLEHRNCSLALIQSALGFNEMPLFNTCIAIRRAVDDEEQSKMDSLVRVVDGAEKTEFAIALGAAIGTLGAEIGITYQKSKISPKCAESITGSLATVIRSLLKVENQNVHEVELIGTEDCELIEQWNTPPDMVNATLHSLVEEQVREAPNAIAISGFDGEYTYAQLNAMAEKLAVLLVARGVRLEDRVVLCFAKSAWPIVAMLAILKAGGVCVSTNADHPTSRQLDICADVDTTVVLCDETNAVRFRGHAPHVIVVDECLLGKLDIPTNWLAPLVKPTNAAFVVYTSGSTGKPKGCVLEHHSVSKSQLVNAKAMNISKSSRAVQFASYSFDASICEIFAPLVTGACVCVVSDNERLDDLAAAIDARKADWIMLTPTVARLFLPSAVPTLRTLVFGGEALSREALDIWRDHVHLVNYWGPSECANSGCLNSNITLHTSAMNIGRASGCNIWITEQKSPHRLAPIGCVGELLVEGPMLGREYINRPEATAAAYVTDLAWSRGRRDYTRRFYRTGDMGRFNSDGSVTFVGRADNQVKIHGQRVELDEIKHQIMVNLPSGSEIVVDVSVGGQSKKPTLVAFVKLDAFSSDSTDHMDLELKDSEKHQEFQVMIQRLEKTLAEVLPQYMIPSTYIPITKVPTTPSAKTDRKLLKEFASSFTRQTRSVRQVDANKKQPANDIERDLQVVWAQILNHPVSKIGIDDTFMSLGGDSMSAMRAVAQCRKLGIKVPVSVILQKKTIAAIAPRCIRTSAQITQIGTTQTRDSIPFQLSPIQQRYFDQESDQGQVQYNQSLLCCIKRPISASQLKDACDIVVNRHGMLRARFAQLENGKWQQIITPIGAKMYRFVSHSLVEPNEEEINRHAVYSGAALNIVDGPVFSVDFFDILNQDSMAFITAHHLVIDIVSWQIILRDLEDVMSGKALSPPSMTWQHWCGIQEAESTSLSAEQVLPLPVPVSQFPYWQVTAEQNIFRDRIQETFDLSTATTDLVLNQSNQAMGTTPLEIILGPLLLSFRQLFPDRDIPSVFVEHHGREPCSGDDMEPSNVVGWFTTMYPLHIPIDQDTTASDAVRLVKDFHRTVPQNGRPYFSYRHLTSGGANKFSHHDPVELLVNFTGIFQQLEASDSLIQLESRIKYTAMDADPKAHRWSMIDVEIGVERGVMKVNFQLNRNMAHLDRIQQWIGDYKKLLSQTAKTLAGQSLAYTLSDFPLLNIGYDDLATLLSQDLPALGIQSKDNIEDIFPLSPFQNYAVEANFDDPPRQWNCFYFELPSNVNHARLRQTCVKLVEQHPTLRTLFINHTGGFLQVILKSLQPQVESYKSDDDINVFTDRIFHDDLATQPPPGTPFLRFIIISTPTHTRLLMRLSHAQFDGFSRTIFVRNLAALYSGRQCPESVSYSRFVRHAKQQHQESCRYWQSALAGAKPTTVVQIITPSPFADNGVIRIERTIPPFRTLEGVTPATVFNAACAILLRSLTSSDDVTFGRITSGRAALDPELQDLVGPCTNIVPIRVRFHDGPSQLSHVLQLIHKQYVESIPHETIGLDDIIHDCTDWSTSMAQFPVVTQYFNLEEGSEAHTSGDGDAVCSVHVWDPVTVDPFPWSLCLGAFPSRAGLRISVAANSRYVERGMVERVVDELCTIINGTGNSGAIKGRG